MSDGNEPSLGGEAPGGDVLGDNTLGDNTLWHGRFASGPAEALLEFTESLSFDVRMAQQDVRGSRAHVRGLRRAEILSAAEEQEILGALDQVETELATEQFSFVATDEDIHTAIERRVTEIAGEVGGKLHTGRSRNDQVATAFRLWVKEMLIETISHVLDLQTVLLQKATEAGDAYLPGYTHLQRAQPIPLGHHLAVHAWSLGRDVDRLFDTLKRTDVSPLGAGALAGTSLPLDPVATASDLGFAATFENSVDVTCDRDFVAESLFALSVLGVHLSRIGEEYCLWASSEFGFVTLDDGFSTGSSMMPQKKNPDIAELTRGKAGRLIGNLTGLLATLKGLPFAYNRDLQEDKEPVFDSADQIRLALLALGGMIATSEFNVDAMADAADDQTALATDLAEILVEGGTPFRQAHAIVGELVRDSLTSGQSLAIHVAAHDSFDSSITELFEPGAALRRRNSRGGAGYSALSDQLGRLGAMIEADKGRLGQLQ